MRNWKKEEGIKQNGELARKADGEAENRDHVCTHRKAHHFGRLCAGHVGLVLTCGRGNKQPGLETTNTNKVRD